MNKHLLKIKKRISKLEFAYFSLQHKLTLNAKVNRLRKKDKIVVLFSAVEPSKWKSDSLYKEMLDHERFSPVILIMPDKNNGEMIDQKIEACRLFFLQKGYDFILPYDEDGNLIDIRKSINPDIIFYTEPYKNMYPRSFFYKKFRDKLFCYISYGFHGIDIKEIVDSELCRMCWHLYYENDISAASARGVMDNNGKNICVTGLPLSDDFLDENREYKYEWKEAQAEIKRIIWAPHHTIEENEILGSYSRFLHLADDMLRLADEYKGRLQFAFKPHPVLKRKLYNIWGKEKTDKYYACWAEMSNTIINEADYLDLFMTSDGLIHDCCSFTIDYMYAHKPVLYIKSTPGYPDNTNEFFHKAYDVHYKASDIEEIKSFIEERVLKGNDTLLSERDGFVRQYLVPPGGKSAAGNIINMILFNNI